MPAWNVFLLPMESMRGHAHIVVAVDSTGILGACLPTFFVFLLFRPVYTLLWMRCGTGWVRPGWFAQHWACGVSFFSIPTHT